MPVSRLVARFFASSAIAHSNVCGCSAGFACGFFMLLLEGGQTFFAHCQAKGELSQQPRLSISCMGRVGSGGGWLVMARLLDGLEKLKHSVDKLFVTNDGGHLLLP